MCVQVTHEKGLYFYLCPHLLSRLLSRNTQQKKRVRLKKKWRNGVGEREKGEKVHSALAFLFLGDAFALCLSVCAFYYCQGFF